MYRNIEAIILASASPRRKEFLTNLGLQFDVVAASISEEPRVGERGDEFVLRMATEKATYVAQKTPEKCVISGDTIVCLGQAILGKPLSTEQAVELLLQLSGQTHIVRSAFCILQHSRNVIRAESVETKVRFADFSGDIARAYVATGESMDKAGAYGIQGLGGALVESIEGSYSNVVGFPLVELLDVLVEENIIEVDLL